MEGSAPTPAQIVTLTIPNGSYHGIYQGVGESSQFHVEQNCSKIEDEAAPETIYTQAEVDILKVSAKQGIKPIEILK